MGDVAGHLVVTDLHGVVGDGYNDDGKEVDFHFREITFPATLPAWYFDPPYLRRAPERRPDLIEAAGVRGRAARA